MSTAIAYRAPSEPDTHHPTSSPHSLPGIESSARPRRHYSPSNQMSSSPHRSQPGLAPRPSVEIVRTTITQNPPTSSTHSQNEPQSPEISKIPQANQDDASSDVQSSQVPIPSVEVKQEGPPTPEPAKSGSGISRHRPRKLDLTTSVPVPSGRPSAPMTAKDSAPLTAMQDIGLACLSPGFQTEDPRMTQQLQRSMDLREEQRRIIESRLHKGGKDADSSGSKSSSDNPSQPSAFSKPPGTSRRKGPPPGLSITAPSAQQFAPEPRVIQSAPLNQTFTGLHNKPNPHPLSRQVLHNSHKQQQTIPERRTSGSGASSGGPQYASYSSSTQSGNRLPPIQDVFANENLGSSSPYRPSHSLHRTNSGPGTSGNGQNNAPLYAPITTAGSQPSRSPNTTTQYAQPLPSPAYPPPQQSAGLQPPSNGRHHSSRDAELKSADEASHAAPGRKDDLFPKIIFGGHQPPTPPSPLPPGAYQGQDQRQYGPSPLKADFGASRTTSGRRRTRDEYERDYEEREEGERMDVDNERERERGRDRPRNISGTSQRAPDQGPAATPNSRTNSGLGFGFGAWSGEASSRHSPDTLRRKKEEFMSLCSRAWDLLHD